MPWSSIASSFSEGGGVWAFVGGLFMTICYVVVGLFGINSKSQIARDADLAARESNLIKHLADEINRLNTLVSDLDMAMKAQASDHAAAMQRERDECNAKMLGLKGEIELLKRRMADEEAR